jgi:hypothetical protein
VILRQTDGASSNQRSIVESREKSPSSISRSTAAAVNPLLIDAIWKRVAGDTSSPVVGSATPSEYLRTISPRRRTMEQPFTSSKLPEDGDEQTASGGSRSPSTRRGLKNQVAPLPADKKAVIVQ